MVLIFLIQYNPIKLWGYTHSKVVAFRTCHGSYIYIFAKGFTEQWKSPPAGELLPRVRSLGAAQFVENKKIPSLCLPIVAHPGQRGICGSDCWPMVMVRPKFGWLWLCSPASGYNVGPREKAGGQSYPHRSSFFCSIFWKKIQHRLFFIFSKLNIWKKGIVQFSKVWPDLFIHQVFVTRPSI